MIGYIDPHGEGVDEWTALEGFCQQCGYLYVLHQDLDGVDACPGETEAAQLWGRP